MQLILGTGLFDALDDVGFDDKFAPISDKTENLFL
jgi:hypothetical protein